MRPTSEFLGSYSIFAELSVAAQTILSQEGQVFDFPRHTYILERGGVPNYLCFLLSGKIHNCIDFEKIDTFLTEIESGNIFCIEGIASNTVLLGDYRTAENSRILLLPAASSRNLIENDLSFAVLMLGRLADATRAAQRSTNSLATRRAVERLAAWLLRRAQGRIGSPIEIADKKAHIARMCSMGPETLSRALSELRAFGVSSNQSRIIIHSLEQLTAFASPHLSFDDWVERSQN